MHYVDSPSKMTAVLRGAVTVQGNRTVPLSFLVTYERPRPDSERTAAWRVQGINSP